MVSRRRQLHSGGHRDRKEKNHTEQAALEGIHETPNGTPNRTPSELVSLSKSYVKLNCSVGAAVAVHASNADSRPGIQ